MTARGFAAVVGRATRRVPVQAAGQAGTDGMISERENFLRRSSSAASVGADPARPPAGRRQAARAGPAELMRRHGRLFPPQTVESVMAIRPDPSTRRGQLPRRLGLPLAERPRRRPGTGRRASAGRLVGDGQPANSRPDEAGRLAANPTQRRRSAGQGTADAGLHVDRQRGFFIACSFSVAWRTS